jgi:hypothetical protein
VSGDGGQREKQIFTKEKLATQESLKLHCSFYQLGVASSVFLLFSATAIVISNESEI